MSPEQGVLGAELLQALEDQRARHALPGLALTVVEAGEAPRSAAVGVVEAGQAQALRPQAIQRWYSLTKPILAAAILSLVAEGRLDLDARVGELLPPWNRDPGPRRAEVRVRDLLTHTSGLRDAKHHAAQWFRAPDRPAPESERELREGLRRHRKLGDDSFHYSNLGYATLGVLLERVEGRPLEEVLRRRVLEPAGASCTGFVAPPQLVRGHARRGRAMAWGLRLLTGRRFFAGRVGRHHLMRPRELIYPAHGGLIGPVTDLGLVLHVLLTGHAVGGARVLAESVLAAQRESVVACAKEPGESASCGFCCRDQAPEARGQPVLYHGGHGPGFSAEMRVLPERGLALGLVGNADFDARAAAIALADALV